MYVIYCMANSEYFQVIILVVLVTLYNLQWTEGKSIWVPRMGMMRVLRRAPNPYNLKIEPPIMLTRKRLLDSKSSEESSEVTDDDDSPDTPEEEDNYDDYYDQYFQQSRDNIYRRKAWRNPDDSNAAEEDYGNDVEPVETLPDPYDIFK